MKFTYKIENYNEFTNKIFVLYFPEDTTKAVLGEYFEVNTSMTQDDIDVMIVNAAPTHKWDIQRNPYFNQFVGMTSELKEQIIPEPTPQPEPTPEELEQQRLAELESRKTNTRRLRNFILEKTDFTQLSDFPNENLKISWAEYRQALRNLPENEDFPDSEFPTPPNIQYIDSVKQLFNTLPFFG